ncbi:hypothetical protein CMO90_00195 [Candidatus Woesearchaeota archaeon]|nr:hypothetical protein [Candidatus Woesearchaeota archaeon]
MKTKKIKNKLINKNFMKIKKFQKELKQRKIDFCILISDDINFSYFFQEQIENSILVIPSKGKPCVFVGPLENIKTSFKKLKYKNPFKDLKNLCKGTIGINESKITVEQKKRFSKIGRTKDVSDMLVELRKIKTKEEVARIRKACYLTEKILKKIVKNFNFKYEKDIKNFIKIESIKNNCELSFEPIVASEKNARIPHYSGNKRIKKGFLLLDIGLKYKGYCSDISRTFYVGEPTKNDVELYKKVLSVQQESIRSLKSGLKTKSLEVNARKMFEDKEKYFIHSLGHGLGMDVHEAPSISLKSKDELKEGMVITIEPGLYHNQGIRIEDDILITKKSHKKLSRFPRELIIIPKL